MPIAVTFQVFNPSSMSQDLMVSMILSTSWVIPLENLAHFATTISTLCRGYCDES
jgi:hypothetical protein